MAGRKVGCKLKRHWFIVRRRGYREILALISAFSREHVLRNVDLKEKDVVIQKAKRWHIARVFSGVPVFYNYKTRYACEDINAWVPNDFYIEMDGEMMLVKILA